MATEKRLIYMEDAIALFEQDIEENKVALKTAYHGDKDAIRSEIVGMRAAISLVNSLARNGFTVDAVEVVRCKDCRWRKERGLCYMISGTGVGTGTGDDFFCSYGERKDNERKSD